MKTFVISLGGSIIVPEDINVEFLKEFRELIVGQINKDAPKRFAIICGGGGVNRMYNSALKEIISPSIPSDETLDLLGISVTSMNACFVKLIFEDLAYENVIDNPTKKIKTDKRIIIGCGWKPGCSTDKDAVLIADNLDADVVINLTDTDYVYTKDPRQFRDANKIEKMGWKDLMKIIGNRWTPKLRGPFDPSAAKLAEKNRLKVIIAKGTDLANLRNIIEGKKFKGTTIE
ncbi:MAG: UMP kinase [Candidatus Woesearchaeota archaeon]|nr:UMP kinase [Candidatus Woesearchaeota archaeon]